MSYDIFTQQFSHAIAWKHGRKANRPSFGLQQIVQSSSILRLLGFGLSGSKSLSCFSRMSFTISLWFFVVAISWGVMLLWFLLFNEQFLSISIFAILVFVCWYSASASNLNKMILSCYHLLLFFAISKHFLRCTTLKRNLIFAYHEGKN